LRYRLCYDELIYGQEHSRIFRGSTWSVLCLEAEIPKSGGFMLSHVDTDEFRGQSEDFAAALTHSGRPVERMLFLGVNHFELIDTLGDAGLGSLFPDF
jgi:hypothetical protein